MSLPSRSPFTEFALFFAVLFTVTAGGFYVSKHYQLPAKPPICELPHLKPETAKTAFVPPVSPPPPPEHPEMFGLINEQMPLFPGADCGDIEEYATRKKCSEKAMLKYIYSHVKYPPHARESGVEGMAVISFVIAKTGAIQDIRVVRDPGAGTGEAAAAVVRQMRADNIRWEPGLQAGKPVKVQFNLPVKFKLE